MRRCGRPWGQEEGGGGEGRARQAEPVEPASGEGPPCGGFCEPGVARGGGPCCSQDRKYRGALDGHFSKRVTWARQAACRNSVPSQCGAAFLGRQFSHVRALTPSRTEPGTWPAPTPPTPHQRGWVPPPGPLRFWQGLPRSELWQGDHRWGGGVTRVWKRHGGPFPIAPRP